MSEYTNLIPIYGTSVMNIHADERNNQVIFRNIITFDYEDKKEQYISFLNNEDNYEKELHMYWDNFQLLLNGEEKNIINDEEIPLKIKHTHIFFKTPRLPSVQYIIKFKGILQDLNIYENFIENEKLEYPIYSVYIFNDPLKAIKVDTTFNYLIAPSNKIIEYWAEKGDESGIYESIFFNYLPKDK